MKLSEYQRLALRTRNQNLSPIKIKVQSIFGLIGEVGELVDHVKKAMFQGHDLDTGFLEKEVGDILWYLADLCDAFNLDIDLCARKNIEKLEQRYPGSVFSEERSRNR